MSSTTSPSPNKTARMTPGATMSPPVARTAPDFPLRSRSFDPTTGQFLSVDPLGLASGDSNFYRYVNNSPINLVDPSGEAPPFSEQLPQGESCLLPPKPSSQFKLEEFSPPKNKLSAQTPTVGEAIGEKLGPQVDLNKIPASRIERLLSEPAIKKVLGEHSPQQPKKIEKREKTVVVTPFDLDGKIVQAVFVGNNTSVAAINVNPHCLDNGGDITDTMVRPETYRFVGVGPSQISPEALADLKVFDQEELESAQGAAQVLTAILHTIPFGTAADYVNEHVFSGTPSGVSEVELALVTVADAALLVGLTVKAATAGAKAAATGVWATRIARGAVIANTISDIGQAGMAVANAVNDPTAVNIAVAAGIATAIIFGASWKLADEAVPNNPKPKPTPEVVVPPPKPDTPKPPKPVHPKTYPFEEQGISYSSVVEKGANGETVIEHFITQDGKKQSVGYSTISKEGVLVNAYDVPEALQKLGISERAYVEAACQGFKSLYTSFNAGPKSVNFNEFFKVYDPAKNNAVEALLQTPAGKVASKYYGLKPDPSTIKITSENVSANWVSE